MRFIKLTQENFVLSIGPTIFINPLDVTSFGPSAKGTWLSLGAARSDILVTEEIWRVLDLLREAK